MSATKCTLLMPLHAVFQAERTVINANSSEPVSPPPAHRSGHKFNFLTFLTQVLSLCQRPPCCLSDPPYLVLPLEVSAPFLQEVCLLKGELSTN